MAKLLIYDAYTNKFYTYDRGENEPMPYSYGNTLTVGEFRGSSRANVLWTTVAAMEAWKPHPPPLWARHPRRVCVQDASGKAATAPPASTMPAWPLTSGRVLAALPAETDPCHGHRYRRLGLCGTAFHDAHWVHFDRRYGTPACPQHHRRVPHHPPGQPQHLCADPAGRAERAGVFQRGAGRHLRFQHRIGPESLAAGGLADGRRRLRLCELAQTGRLGRRPSGAPPPSLINDPEPVIMRKNMKKDRDLPWRCWNSCAHGAPTAGLNPARCPPGLLAEAVDAARIASCGTNRQTVKYIIVQTPETVAKIQPLVHWAAALPPEQGPPPPGGGAHRLHRRTAG